MPNFQIRKMLLSIGDDFWVEDEQGERVFKVDGKAFRLRKTFVIETTDGEEVVRVQERKLRLHDTMAIERQGQEIATVRKAKLTPLHDKFKVDLAHGGQLEAKGDLLDHEFTLAWDNGTPVAEISKRWFSVRDTYGVSVEAGQDAVLALAVAICIDSMERD